MKPSLFLWLLPIALVGCSAPQPQHEQGQSVKAMTVGAGTGTATSSFPGKVKATGEAHLSFRIAGPISQIHAQPGKLVRRGELLATLDARDYATQLAATEAEYASVKAQVDRIARLHEQQSVSANDYDKAVGALKQITEKLRAHRNALSDTRLVAPYDGYIREPLRRAGETVAAGMPVLTIYSNQTPEVEIAITAEDYLRRAQFEHFVCTTDADPTTELPLRLISIDPIASANQLYSVRLAFDAAADLPLPTIGMNANVRLSYRSDHEHSTTIPMTAVWERNQRSYVWAISQDSLHTIRPVEVRLREIKRDGTAVCLGLQPQMTIVAAGAASLREGQRVRPIPEPSSTNVGELL